MKIKIHKTVILPVVLYGCETWSLKLRKGHRLRVSENKVLRIFGSKRGEATEGLRKLYNNEELHSLYSSPNIIRVIKSRRMRWAGHVQCMGETRSTYKILVGKPEGKRPIQRLWHRWEDNIMMDVREIGFGGVYWIHLTHDRDRQRALVNTVMNLLVP
jgi:hypothetical protein